MERRTMIRLLVGLAIGIPLLVEGVTFFGLVEHQLFGGDEETPAATPTADSIGVGDELLPATAPSETVTEAEIRGQDTPWLFVLTVEVENSLEVPYELQLGTLTLQSGDTFAGESSTGRIPAGEAGQVTGVWELPEGSTPATLAVNGVTYRENDTEVIAEAVTLGKVPVRGG